MNYTKIIIPMLASLLLSGCETTRYEYAAPNTDSGRQCTALCASVREMCRGNEQQRAQFEKQSCERSADNSYFLCMNRAKNRDQEKDCLSHRNSCYASENTYRCEDEYRQCFTNCGGTIKTIIEK